MEKSKIWERIASIVVGIVFGLVMSYFVRQWNENGLMKITQWATLLGFMSLVVTQFPKAICQLISTLILATLVGSMAGITLDLGANIIIIISAASILLMAIIFTTVIASKRQREKELWSRINDLSESSAKNEEE